MLAQPMVVVFSVALLAAVPIAALLFVRHGQPEHPARLSPGRFFLSYAVNFALLLLAARVDGLPASLIVLGIVLGLLGLGVGVASLYRFLYGRAWLDQHPGVVQRDIARWQRVTLATAAVCLLAGLVLALGMVDVAHAP
jgi:hypothetical protein